MKAWTTARSWFLTVPVLLWAIAGQAQYLVPSSGLVSWWRGEGNANDSADSNNGSTLNGAGYAPGIVGSAFSLDGMNDHVRVANSANLQITSTITVAAWVNRASLGSYDEVISKWDAVPIGQRSYSLAMHPDGRGYFLLSAAGQDGGVTLLTTSPLPINTWLHLAATYDGVSTKLYVNGVLNSQVAYSGGIFSGSDDLAIGGVVGGVGGGSGISFFHGKIDEAVIYNRALLESEVVSLAAVPEPSSGMLVMAGSAFLLLLRKHRDQNTLNQRSAPPIAA